MPRRPRVHLDGVPLHIVQRGHNREPCFFAVWCSWGQVLPFDSRALADDLRDGGAQAALIFGGELAQSFLHQPALDGGDHRLHHRSLE